MPKQLNEHPQSKLNQTLRVAKKLSGAGLKILNQLNTAQVAPVISKPAVATVIDGIATEPKIADQQNVDQVLGSYLPYLSQRALGRHHGKMLQAAQLLSPISMTDVTGYLSQRLGACADRLSSIEQVLEQAGVKDFNELRQDLSRSGRLSNALIEQNKLFAVTQGAFAAVTGFIGVAVDVPSSLILALRVIYQTGRAYGFSLEQQEREIVDYIFKQIRLDLLAEKQTLLFGLSTVNQLLKQNDLNQLQHLLGSNSNVDWLKNVLSNNEGELKWPWLNQWLQVSNVARLTPLVAASIGGSYNWRFIQDVGQKAQHVFSVARDYLNQNPSSELSIIEAYQHAVAAVPPEQATSIELFDENPAATMPKDTLTPTHAALNVNPDAELSDVELNEKESAKIDAAPSELTSSTNEALIEPIEEKTPAQTALKPRARKPRTTKAKPTK
ncbi:EcsC family protein [Acinetobacter sp. MD2(2019)]|uniref:EcsC family protein n=1 Tax=Acinetobacter sp. MD2(2019) TaxID=2605273 RepID=UPI002D1ED0B8|nr:EcsC family protein [Acinetobacter sp. MD2(2019)]MEB3755156.1 EcsC family protein [Acinetobacter sp. MD2(2019)]